MGFLSTLRLSFIIPPSPPRTFLQHFFFFYKKLETKGYDGLRCWIRNMIAVGGTLWGAGSLDTWVLWVNNSIENRGRIRFSG